MWRTMYECHQVQNHISLQLNHISLDQIRDLTSDYHRRAASQLETEADFWYQSFCYLVQSQKDYVKTLCGWVQLTDSLIDDQQHSNFSSALRSLCEQWLHRLERIPEQVFPTKFTFEIKNARRSSLLGRLHVMISIIMATAETESKRPAKFIEIY